MELFRTLLMQKITYFDKHTAGELASLISTELDTIRSFVFRWVELCNVSLVSSPL